MYPGKISIIIIFTIILNCFLIINNQAMAVTSDAEPIFAEDASVEKMQLEKIDTTEQELPSVEVEHKLIEPVEEGVEAIFTEEHEQEQLEQVECNSEQEEEQVETGEFAEKLLEMDDVEPEQAGDEQQAIEQADIEEVEEESEADKKAKKDADFYKALIEDNSRQEFVDKYTDSFTSRDYILGPNDVLSIRVAGVPELDQGGLRINPEGRISFIFIENLKVAGMTLEKLKKVLTYHYKEYLVNPDITVNLEQSRPFIVYISGAVFNPGSYELNTVPNQSPYITKPEAFIERKTPLLSNIIVAAGGLAYDADIEHVQIKNELDGSVHEVNLFNLISDSDFAQDFYLMAGDKVFVPKLPSPAAIDDNKYRILVRSTLFQRDIPVRVIGYVNRPGLVMLDSDQSANINSAIAAAGGYITNYGSYPKRVQISRLDNNNKLVTITVNPLRDDISIMPNDIIYVPEKTMPLIAKLFDYAIRLMNPFGVFSNTYQSWENMLD